MAAETEAARRQRAGSWRVPMPSGELARVRIRLDATLEIPGHPLVACDLQAVIRRIENRFRQPDDSEHIRQLAETVCRRGV